jgi:hypothetical protein
VPHSFVLFAAAVLAGLAPAAAQDAREIILRSAARSREDVELRKNYTYTVVTEQRRLDKSGRVTKTESVTEEVMILYGRRYERVVARDGQPLPPDQERKEREKMDKEMARRARETPEQKAKRAQEDEKNLRQQEEILLEVADAFDFRLAGEDIVDGHPAWVIQAEPKAGYRPRSRETRILPNFRGTAWISREDYRWVKVEAEVIRTISVGLVLARLHPGTTLAFEQQRVQDEVWMPRRARLRLSARLGLVKTYHMDVLMDFSGYRKFQAESRITGTMEIEPRTP